MPNNPIITLTTDFGYEDAFVGVMKGVIMSIAPDVRIVDITHGIRPQDMQEAAFTIGMNYQYFPQNSIHVVVVDPGVGSARRPLLVFSDNHYFIGPDNGVFSYIYRKKHERLDVRHITADHYFLQRSSPTFQGRDVFASVAAWFARGVRLEKFGEPIADYHAIDLPFPELGKGVLKGRIIHIDRFGNAISNIEMADIGMLSGEAAGNSFRTHFRGADIPLKTFYYEAGDKRLYALVNSSGYIEFFVVGGSAASEYKISLGEKIEIFPA